MLMQSRGFISTVAFTNRSLAVWVPISMPERGCYFLIDPSHSAILCRWFVAYQITLIGYGIVLALVAFNTVDIGRVATCLAPN